jgi:hypothetical protein
VEVDFGAGPKTVSGPAAYLPLNSSFEVVSAISALASAPDGKLALLPSGTLSQPCSIAWKSAAPPARNKP